MSAAAIPNADLYTAAHLEDIFERCFAASTKTILVGGANEPSYQPASGAEEYHRIFYREDYFASVLHEVAHWCIAGSMRRLLNDFGYWYAPDGRTAEQQQDFERVEVKPQALEWLFSLACASPFQVSVDNLEPTEGALPDTYAFRSLVFAQAHAWQSEGLPERAKIFFAALSRAFNTGSTCETLLLRFADLR